MFKRIEYQIVIIKRKMQLLENQERWRRGCQMPENQYIDAKKVQNADFQ